MASALPSQAARDPRKRHKCPFFVLHSSTESTSLFTPLYGARSRAAPTTWSCLDQPSATGGRLSTNFPDTICLKRVDIFRAARLVAGDRWVAGDWVFAGPFGAPLNAWAVRRHFAAPLQRAGLPAIHFHDLRHTTATLLLGQGVHPKVVADLLGHATVAITLDRYSHVAVAMHQQAADALEAVLGDRGPPRVGSLVGSTNQPAQPKTG